MLSTIPDMTKTGLSKNATHVLIMETKDSFSGEHYKTIFQLTPKQ
jgi:hypothetical protein